MLTINNTIDGAIQDIEIKGNTVQDPDNLSDIKSVGELQEDGTYKMSISSCGKNLFNIIEEPFKNNGNINLISYDNNSIVASLNENSNWAYIKVPLTNLKPNTDYVFSYNISTNRHARVYQGTSVIDNTISGTDLTKRKFNTSNYTDLSIRFFVTTDNGENGEVTFSNIQLEEGTQLTSYEPYQENKCDILLPCQLEKVGDVADRLYYDDVEKAWCIEKKAKPKVEENVIVNKQDRVEKIVLPLSTQIALNSFFGTTHIYMESGEVEGTIKCKIPKSLGATVQSLNNKTDILSDRIEAIEGLKDSQNMKYETDKGYLVCKETKNGVIDDLKIEGKTLVNLINDIEKDIGLSVSTDAKYDFVRKLIPNTTYTLSYTIKDLVIGTSDGVILSINKSNSYGIKEWNVNANGNYITTITTPSSTENLQLWFFAKSNAEGFSGKVCDVILLEGDHTQNPPSYFEGLMSVGQDVDKIEVLSSNNLLEEDEDYKQDKKQILFYNENGELEPIQELHEWDSIEKHSDNKWYYHKRSGKVVLNGSENWNNDTNSSTISPATYRQSIQFDAINIPNSAFNTQTSPNIISNSLPTVIFGDVYSHNHIGISISGTDSIGTHIIINNNFMDVTELKQWLQANNVTVVYQLAQEEVYELAPLHLDSYANETLILCNSGAISPKMEFSITSHINELVKAYGERINLLEEKVYKYMVAQNRLQLASTYSADSVTFKVDYFSLCGDEENYNEDLYNLILNNILVGKDNYDYDKMFTMILDYASWNQISWEQFDILVGLMDIQHNPPIEELPTEDEIEEDIIENEETPVE